jgi:NADH:ubiquinone oxidoreductase subunit K
MTLTAYLLAGLLLFSLGLITVLSRRNQIAILVGTELMMTAASLNFLAFNRFTALDPVVGQIVVLVIIGLAAAEVSIFLSILMVVYRSRHSIDVEDMRELKG